MKRSKILCIAGAAMLFFSTASSHAQEYVRKELSTELEKVYQDVLANNDQYFVISYPWKSEDGPVFISAFDRNDLKQAYSKKLEQADHYGTGMYVNKTLYLFASNKDEQMFCYTIDDKNGTVKEQRPLYRKKEARDPFSDDVFKGASEDSAYFYLFSKTFIKREKGASFSGVVMDRQMKVVNTFSFITEDNYEDVDDMKSVLSNNGSLSIIYNSHHRSGRDGYNPQKYTLVQISPAGKAKTMVMNLPTGDLRSMEWKEKGGKLLFTGFLGKERKMGLTNFVSGTYDAGQQKTTGLKETPLNGLLSKNGNSNFIQKMIEKGLDHTGLEPMGVDYIVKYSDGSRMIVYQVRSSYSKQFSSHSIIFETRGNFFIMKLNAANEPQWMRVVRRFEEEPDLDLHLGACYMEDENGGVHILYHDVMSNKSAEPTDKYRKVAASDGPPFTAVYVTPDGQMKKSFVFDIDEGEFHMSPERAYTIGKNEVAFIAIRHTGMKFSPKQLFTKAQYKLGTIILKP